MGQLVQLTASGQLTHATLASALTHPEPGVRAVAARIVGIRRILSQGAALIAALSNETDAHVISEQVTSLLTLRTPETIAAVEQALDRPIVAAVPYLAWLARTNPDKMIERLPSLVERPELPNRLGATVLIAAATHPGKRDALFRAVQRLKTETAWTAIVRAMVDGTKPTPTDLVLLEESLASSNGTLREQTVWAIVGRLASSPPVPSSVLSAVMTSATAASADTTAWESLGREIVARHVRRSPGEDRSALILTAAPQHRSDAMGLILNPAVSSREKSAVRSALNLRNDEDEIRSMVADGLPESAQRASSMRLFPTIWPGFIESLLRATNCRASEEVRLGLALVTFGTDGRPTDFTFDAAALTPECAIALQALRYVTLADPSEIPTEAAQWHLLPVSSAFVACDAAPRPPAIARDENTSSGQTVTTPQKTRDVRPVYPTDARKAGIQGTVVIDAVIATTGCISSAKVIRSPSPLLDFEAMRVVSRWHYTVPRLGDTPVAVLMTVTVNFRLK